MNLYALLSLCASAICVPLGLSVYFLNRKSTVNKLFMLTMFANAYWAFGEFMLRQTISFETAVFWGKTFAVWPFLAALLFHFTLAFTESDVLKNKLIYVAIYFPAAIFSIIDLTTNWISLTPTLKFWGYTPTASNSAISILDGVWSASLGILIILLFASYYTKVVDKTKKQQTKFISVAFAIPICTSILTDTLLPFVGINFPGLGTTSGTLMSFFVLYAMWRYELFGFRPEIAVENVFSAMADVVILADLQGIILKVNRALLQVSSCTEDEVLGKSISEVVTEAGILGGENAFPLFLARLRKERELRNLELTFRSKSGEKHIGLLSCSMVCDNKGFDVGITFVVHDISELKAMEQKLLKSERLASIGELAGILGHDLRNPLNAMRTASYYLKTKHADVFDSKDAAIFESIDSSINYSNKIVNDLIDYSSEIRLELEPVTPHSLVGDALGFVSAPQSIKVVDETLDAPKFLVDAGRLSRGFANIVRNAFDAMPNGGELHIKCEVAGESAIFSFRDTGQGMSQETLAKVWTPLFTTKAKGMGFGLPICRRAVEAHNGHISAESQLALGTTIKVELPLNLKFTSNENPLLT